MTTSERLMTADDLWDLPDDGKKRYELVRGELRTTAPAGFEHGEIGTEIVYHLKHFVRTKGLGTILGADTGFILGRNPDTVRSPDAAFVSRERLRSIGRTKKFFPGAPDLAVEVLSPSDTVYETEEKVNDWLAAGTRIVWVVNPKQRTITVHKAGPQIQVLTEKDQLSGEDVVPGFACAVGELFSLA